MYRCLVVPLALAGAVMLGGAAGCSSKTLERYQDAPVGAQNENPADLIRFPDGYSNVASKCDGPNRVYVAFKGDEVRAAVAVVGNDPRCTGAAR